MKLISPNAFVLKGALTGLVVCLVMILPVSAQSGGQYDLSWITIDGGGGTSTGGPYTFSCTLGQPDANWASGGDYELLFGFWTGEPFGAAPIYRFWAPVNQRHFYTIEEAEKDKLINIYAHVWTYEGIVYYAFETDSEPGLVPVYRFWSPVLVAHFYTISESERDKLINIYPHVWTYEGIAFYAYPEGQQPGDAEEVYRFWSPVLETHFYTMNETEKNKLIDNYPHVWTYEGIAWYAYE